MRKKLILTLLVSIITSCSNNTLNVSDINQFEKIDSRKKFFDSFNSYKILIRNSPLDTELYNSFISLINLSDKYIKFPISENSEDTLFFKETNELLEKQLNLSEDENLKKKIIYNLVKINEIIYDNSKSYFYNLKENSSKDSINKSEKLLDIYSKYIRLYKTTPYLEKKISDVKLNILQNNLFIMKKLIYEEKYKESVDLYINYLRKYDDNINNLKYSYNLYDYSLIIKAYEKANKIVRNENIVNEYQEILKFFKNYNNINFKSFVYNLIANYYVSINNLDLAIENYKFSIDINPYQYNIYYNISLSLRKQNKSIESIIYGKKELELLKENLNKQDNDNSFTIIKSNDSKSLVYSLISDNYLNMKDYNNAIYNLIKIEPSDNYRSDDLNIKIANLYHIMNDNDNYIKYLIIASKQYYNECKSCIKLGDYYSSVNDKIRASYYYSKVKK